MRRHGADRRHGERGREQPSDALSTLWDAPAHAGPGPLPALRAASVRGGAPDGRSQRRGTPDGAADTRAVDPDPGRNEERLARPWYVLMVVLSVAVGLVVAVSALDLVAVAADVAAVIGEAFLEVGLPLLCAGLGLWMAVRALRSRRRPDR